MSNAGGRGNYYFHGGRDGSCRNWSYCARESGFLLLRQYLGRSECTLHSYLPYFNQHGFRKGRSTVGAIKEVMQFLTRAWWSNHRTRDNYVLVALNVKNAFNSGKWVHKEGSWRLSTKPKTAQRPYEGPPTEKNNYKCCTRLGTGTEVLEDHVWRSKDATLRIGTTGGVCRRYFCGSQGKNSGDGMVQYDMHSWADPRLPWSPRHGTGH